MHVFSRAAGARGLLIAALALAPAVASGPALAQTAAATAPLPDGDRCSPMMARWQSAEAEHSALKPADLDAYNVAQNEIDRAAHLCEAGDDAAAAAVMARSERRPPDLQNFNAKASP